MFRKNRNQCSAASGIRVQLKRNLQTWILKSIKNILTAGQDKSVNTDSETKPVNTQNKYGITRGADYYRR